MLKELLLEELVILEEYESPDFKKKTRAVDLLDYSKILDNPALWYPSGEPIYSINITEKGIRFLDNLSEQDKRKLENHLLRR